MLTFINLITGVIFTLTSAEAQNFIVTEDIFLI